MDKFGRTIDYLRISVTDRCNERCLYCMPEGYQGWEQQPDHLTAAELIRVVRVAAGMGFHKFRLTGGEPLVRADFLEIVRAMHPTAAVFINDNEGGLLYDSEVWLEKLAPHEPVSGYHHYRTGEDNADAHLKRQIMGR